VAAHDGCRPAGSLDYEKFTAQNREFGQTDIDDALIPFQDMGIWSIKP
jgi:hypothetical protein